MSEFGRYTSRPVTVEAFKWEGSNTTDEPQWFVKAVALGLALPNYDGSVIIATLEGDMIANVGDWIIQGTESELYPCKDSVFRHKYVLAEEQFERRASRIGGE